MRTLKLQDLTRWVIALLMALAGVSLAAQTGAPVDISGTWAFSVDLDEGGHGDPTFTFKQDKDRLSGTYSGPLGEYRVTGTVKGGAAVFGFDFTSEGATYRATYTGKIESSTTMAGTLEFSSGARGKWTATRSR